MDEGRILIVSLQKGMIGELPARFLGALIVAALSNAAFSRTDLLAQGIKPRPFYLFADEYHAFVSLTFDHILSEARKYALFFRLAGQFLGQAEPRLQQSILVNCGSTIVFRCSADDAERMARHLSWNNPDYLHGLANYTAMGRFLVGGRINGPYELTTYPPPLAINDRVEEMMRYSASRFGRDRQAVEEKISAFLRSHGKAKRKPPPARWEG